MYSPTASSLLEPKPYPARTSIPRRDTCESVHEWHETAPGGISGGRSSLVAGTVFEPATSGL